MEATTHHDPASLHPVIDPPISRPCSDASSTQAVPGAVVRYTTEMLGTEVMAAYPWSHEHGWSASKLTGSCRLT
jgi:hypothetical protein